MTKKNYRVAVAGATGAVGRKMIEMLERRRFPVAALKLLASSRSAGTTLEYLGQPITVEELKAESFKDVELALFSAGASVSLEFAPSAWKHGCAVIDNSSAWRMDPGVPLVVPEVNPQAAAAYKNKGIIANPNCSTIQMVVALKPLHDAARIKRIVVSTYQAVSGAGQRGVDELSRQVRDVLNFRPPACAKFPHQIAFNCLPHIDVFLDDGDTREEWKMQDETRKIMGEPDLGISATAVRVPVFYGHGESVNVEFERDLPPEKAREILRTAPGVAVVDDPAKNKYPLAIDCVDREETFVGRIRRDPSVPHGLNLWIVADNLLKGAALNAVQIAELLAENDFYR